MSFARSKKNQIEAVDVATLSPKQIEARIIEGVKRFATRQENWASADGNTPFLGQIIGMGIESANLVDITMTMEKLFLVNQGGTLGRLVISEGEDAFAATPGLAVKMLMEAGHVAKDTAYLEEVISFGNIVVLGEGYRLNQQLQRAYERWQKAPTEEKQDAEENCRALVKDVMAFVETTQQPSHLAATRQEKLQVEEAAFKHLTTEYEAARIKADEAEKRGDSDHASTLKAAAGTLRVRQGKASLNLRVATKVAEETSIRRAVEALRFEVLHGEMRKTVDAVRKELTGAG